MKRSKKSLTKEIEHRKRIREMYLIPFKFPVKFINDNQDKIDSLKKQLKKIK